MVTREEERRKYEKMWAQSSYRRNSPGLNAAPRAIALLGMRMGYTVMDYGCGIPKARDYFHDYGLHAFALDIVPLRDDVIEACLWDLDSADVPVTDFGYCADVMEHVPPENVDAVLAGISKRTRIGAVFTIASVECKQGKRYGEDLHLTIQPRAWWSKKLREHFRLIEVHHTDREWRHLFVAWNTLSP